MAAVFLVLLAHPVAAGNTDDAYSFSVCSGSGGAHGVDFRSHFATYAAQHRIKGWVRNACNDCAYGMFDSLDNGPAADELAAILRDPKRVLAELASKASNITTNVTKIDTKIEAKSMTSLTAHCPGSPALPWPYGANHHVEVDWTFAQNCADPCSCAPTTYHDCQQSTPLPAAAPYTKDCQRSPLGNSTKNFPDCNSIRTHPMSNATCYIIKAGEIVPSGDCTGGWVGLTHAALTCCGPVDAATGNRAGFTIPPAPAECSAFTTDDGYKNKCTTLG